MIFQIPPNIVTQVLQPLICFQKNFFSHVVNKSLLLTAVIFIWFVGYKSCKTLWETDKFGSNNQTASWERRRYSFQPARRHHKLSQRFWVNVVYVNNIPTMQFSTGISRNTLSNYTCYHWLSVSGISKIMHCVILSLTCPILIATWLPDIGWIYSPWW